MSFIESIRLTYFVCVFLIEFKSVCFDTYMLHLIRSYQFNWKIQFYFSMLHTFLLRSFILAWSQLSRQCVWICDFIFKTFLSIHDDFLRFCFAFKEEIIWRSLSLSCSFVVIFLLSTCLNKLIMWTFERKTRLFPR